MVKKPSMGVIILGSVEILTFISIFATLLRLDYYPMILLFVSPFVVLLGVFTILLRPMARSLNLLLSPIVVLAYLCTFMIIIENAAWLLGLSIQLNKTYFYLFFVSFLVLHIFFFRHPKVKEQFYK